MSFECFIEQEAKLSLG